MKSTTRDLHPFLRAIHWFILLNFLVQIGYGAYMTFVVMAPAGGGGPLFGAASSMPFEDMMVRRLYASETWLAIVGASLYFGVTEILPRVIGRGTSSPD